MDEDKFAKEIREQMRINREMNNALRKILQNLELPSDFSSMHNYKGTKDTDGSSDDQDSQTQTNNK